MRGGSSGECRRTQDRPPGVALSRRKLWTFRLTGVVLLPVLVLLVLELALRVTGYGFSVRAVVPRTVKGVRCFVSNDSFSRLFFPPRLAREFDPFVIPVEKPDGHCRVIVLGASAVQGVPDGAYSFSRMLGVLLEERYPGAAFEVYNAGMTAINSHCIVPLIKDLRKCRADVFVVYLGNNEVVGPYGAGTVLSRQIRNIALIRAHIASRALRVGQLLSHVAGRLEGEQIESWGGMEMFVEQTVPLADARLDIVYDHFKRNLADICTAAKDAKAAVVLSTVGTNLRDCAPLASVHREGLTQEERTGWETLYAEGIQLEQQGSLDDAIDRYRACAAIDDSYADLHFRLARLYEQQSAWDEARQHYVLAREADALRFRADDRINSIIREVVREADDPSILLVDSTEALAERSEHRMPGKALFYEHVHLTFEGNAAVAGALLDGIEGALPAWVRSKRIEGSPLTTEALARRLAFTAIDQFTSWATMLEVYLRKPPFTNQLYHATDIAAAGQIVNGLKAGVTKDAVSDAAEIYRTAVEKRPADWWLRWKHAEFLAEYKGDAHRALEECRATLAMVPQFRKGHVQLAAMLSNAGQIAEAQAHYRQALHLQPNDAAAMHGLGMVASSNGRTDEAIAWYRKALSVDRRHAGAALNLGEALVRAGRQVEAIAVYEEAAAVLPDNASLHYNLGVLYYRNAQRKQALEHMRRALSLEPSEDIRETLKAMERR